MKRYDFLIEISTLFYYFLSPNKYQLILLTYDIFFQSHHTCKSFESRLLASTKFNTLEPLTL